MALNEGCILRISKIEPRPIARISRRDQVQRVVQEGGSSENIPVFEIVRMALVMTS